MASKSEKYDIACVRQGVPKKLMSPVEAKEWFTRERDYWRDTPGLTGEIVRYQVRYGDPQLSTGYLSLLDPIVSTLERGEQASAQIDYYLHQASMFRLVLVQGTIVQSLPSVSPQDALLFFLAALSPAITEKTNHRLSQLPDLAVTRLTVIASPWLAKDADILTASHAADLAAQASALAEGTKDEMLRFMEERSERMLEEERVFNEKIRILGPARYWGDIAKFNSILAYCALAAFVALLVIPVVVVWCNWSAFSAYLDRLVTETSGSFSLAGIAIITVPTLAYGWFLRHVSRLFVQSLAIAADAKHRQVLAATYLGLNRLKSSGLTDADRALILNALFRSAPPHAAEDGPPTGLLDLIRKS